MFGASEGGGVDEAGADLIQNDGLGGAREGAG